MKLDVLCFLMCHMFQNILFTAWFAVCFYIKIGCTLAPWPGVKVNSTSWTCITRVTCSVCREVIWKVDCLLWIVITVWRSPNCGSLQRCECRRPFQKAIDKLMNISVARVSWAVSKSWSWLLYPEGDLQLTFNFGCEICHLLVYPGL